MDSAATATTDQAVMTGCQAVQADIQVVKAAGQTTPTASQTSQTDRRSAQNVSPEAPSATLLNDSCEGQSRPSNTDLSSQSDDVTGDSEHDSEIVLVHEVMSGGTDIDRSDVIGQDTSKETVQDGGAGETSLELQFGSLRL